MSEMDASLVAGLTKAAIYLSDKIKKKAESKGLPTVIADAMSIDPATVAGSEAKIEIKIDLKKAPMAAAFEWGSGQHDPRGARLIPIETTKYPSLVFFWERGGHWWKGPKLTRGHPGVAPLPYITPTITEELPQIKTIIGREVKAAILYNLEEKFRT